MVGQSLFLLFLSCFAWPCLCPAQFGLANLITLITCHSLNQYILLQGEDNHLRFEYDGAKSDKAVRDEEVEKEQEVQSQNVKQEEPLSSNNVGPGGLAD